MAATGQGAGGGTAASGGDGGAGAPAPATGTPGAGAAPSTDNDPFGFAAAVASAPEHLRPMLQTEFDRIAPNLTERLGRYQPVEPFLERLSPLVQPGEDGASTLDGLLEFYAMTGDENRTEEFNDWWEKVGETYGFFGDDGEDAGDDDGGSNDGEPQDPRDAQISQLQQEIEALRSEFTANREQDSVNTAAQQISSELTDLMRAAKIDGHDAENPLQSEAAQDILAIAYRFGEDPDGIKKAVARYLQINGQGQADLMRSAGQDVSGLEALQGLLGGGQPSRTSPTPGPALGRGNADHEPEPVRGWGNARELALERFRAG